MNTNKPHNVIFNIAIHAGLLIAGVCLAGWTVTAAEDAASDSKEDTEKSAADYRNWFDVSVGGVFIDGSKASFQHRKETPKDAFGGVESFHWEHKVGEDAMFKIDGRSIFDNHDYLLKLELSHPDKGYLRAGYKEFRTWYDGTGGFYPQNGKWFSLYDDELAIDRGEVWFEAGLTLPDKPVVILKYSHQFRNGEKDSTSWGDANPTDGSSTRSIVPSFWDIDEKRDIFTGDVKHTVGNTDLGLGLRYELQDNNNSRNIRRQPYEGPLGTVDRYVTHRERVESDLFNVHATTETRFNEKVMFTSGYSFMTLDSDLSGSRIYGADYYADYTPAFANAWSFINLGGGSHVKQHVINLNLMLTPREHLTIIPSVRVQREDLESISSFWIASAPLTGPFTEDSDRGLTEVSERLEARYTGLKNWVLYTRGDWSQLQGDLSEGVFNNVGTTTVWRLTDDERYIQKYSAGANWYPLRRLNLGAQYYHLIRNSEFDHEPGVVRTGAGGGLYPAFFTARNLDTDDLNLRVTYRPLNNLTLVSRYDFQLSTIDETALGLPEINTAETTSHIFGESITWAPISRLYIQGSLNYVLDSTDTPATSLTGTVLESQNDYWNATVSSGYALNKKTDLQAQYFYYRADNYVDNSAFGLPFGAGAEEHGVTIGMVRRIRDNLRWTLKYGFFNNREQTTGGLLNYDAHLVYSSIHCRF